MMQGSYLVGGWGIATLGAPVFGTLLAALSGVIGLFIVIATLRMGLLHDASHQALKRER